MADPNVHNHRAARYPLGHGNGAAQGQNMHIRRPTHARWQTCTSPRRTGSGWKTQVVGDSTGEQRSQGCPPGGPVGELDEALMITQFASHVMTESWERRNRLRRRCGVRGDKAAVATAQTGCGCRRAQGDGMTARHGPERGEAEMATAVYAGAKCRGHANRDVYTLHLAAK